MERKEPLNIWFKIIVTESICVGIIILGLFVIKYFFKNEFNTLTKWYEQSITVDTSINEVLKGGDGIEI